MAEFSFRKYCEERDFDIIYKEACSESEKTTAYHVTGCSCYPKPQEFKDSIKKQAARSAFPTIVVDSEDHAIGISYPYYRDRPGKYYKIYIHLWKMEEVTSKVLYHTMEALFSNGHTSMIVCKVMGYEQELLNACQINNMEQVGCIPNYRCYEGTLYPEYIMIMKYENWLRIKSSIA